MRKGVGKRVETEREREEAGGRKVARKMWRGERDSGICLALLES